MTEKSIIIEEAAVPLLEVKPRADGAIPCAIITEGWGTSGYYSADVLKEAAPLYKRGTHNFWNHQTRAEARERPERDLRDLASVLVEDAHYDAHGPRGPGLYAAYKPFSHFAPAIKEMAPHIGMSHVAVGVAEAGEAGGRSGTVIKSISEVYSVDFVTIPGRGGSPILEAFAEVGRLASMQDDIHGDTMAETITIEEVRKHPEILEAIRKDVLESAAMQEAQAQQEKKLKESEARAEALMQENARLKEAQILTETAALVASKVKEAKVPEITKARIIEALAKAPVIKDGRLDVEATTAKIEEAIKAEADYLAKVTGGGKIAGMGGKAPESGGVTVAEAETRLVEEFMSFGLSEAQAKAAAKGR